MEIKTHNKADSKLLGTPIKVQTDKMAIVELITCEEMGVDEHGLVHGGFTFGLADYAAMLAVNDPLVVISSANVKFVAPVRVGDKIVARADVVELDGRRREVETVVCVDDKMVFKGTMTCFVLKKHVLD